MDIAWTEEQLFIAAITVGVLLLALVIVGLVLLARRRRRHERLQGRFGPEYERTVQREGSRQAADELDGRLADHEQFHPTVPDEQTRDELRRRVAALQFRFVDEPADVMLETQRVVVDALRACAYPVAEERARALRLLSVDHPQVTDSLRRLLDGSYGTDVGRMQALFTDVKRALRDVAHVTFGPDDLTGGPDGARAAAPEVGSARSTTSQPASPAREPTGRRPASAVPEPPSTSPADPTTG